MKNVLLALGLLFLSVAGKAQVAEPAATIAREPEVIVLDKDVYDFGKIVQGKPVTHVFQITNKGTGKLTLTDVHASCGCTTPVWSKDTLAPGATSKITVGFNAASSGVFIKPIVISYSDGGMVSGKEILIKGEVFAVPEIPAPYNEAVQAIREDK